MKCWREREWIAGAFGLSLLLMGVVSMISYQNATQLIQSGDKVKRTHEALKDITDVFATLNDADAGRRGYILFGNHLELKRYEQAMNSLDAKVETLEKQVADNYSQQQLLIKLKSLIVQRGELSRQFLDLYQSGQLSLTLQGSLIQKINHNRSEIGKTLARMENREQDLLQIWVRKSQYSIRNRMFVEFGSTLLTFTILLSVFAVLYQQMVKRQQSEAMRLALAKEKELSELKLNFFSMVSHEFRTPLSIILGSAQLLSESDQQWTEEKKIKNLHRIQSASRSMNQMLTDILTLSRADAGKLKFQPEIIDVEAFCINLIEDIKFSINPKHQIKFVSKCNFTHAKLDEKLLYSILSNLLSNAIKYSPEGGTIQLTLRRELKVVIFELEDEGVGISLEFQKYLYEPFRRGDNVGKIVGTGLGLAVVKKCLDLHQGEIDVKSQVGLGTKFTIRIAQSLTEVAKGL
ncbi:ATP-binding protein [Aetokthonos hydrillicola Thurmond2011]|jgi:signal transduction histidine kinase|uniref:histidine kinase n=1 Tax=Aetokthonos hydrillicola Thurmond2011 TaxID=2712845 RepID=A0AAP5ICY1_9CYAN|nr:ATP-binding protein [Aetokthonos hydrillicola]MBO3458366.1 histidine kinase [Aetokthonos hydrillicola CCALA 1050]MBW4586095.1 CHASE3 domain-containing protein [Aetokthonos hydrillicola CCALA 1050]MDR9897702.1 ATP-binding protein [Aetokthonos hydrillicola Thurmond2011]